MKVGGAAVSHAVRVDAWLVERAQALADQAIGQPTVASVIRQAIALGLDALEGKSKPTKRRAR